MSRTTRTQAAHIAALSRLDPQSIEARGGWAELAFVAFCTPFVLLSLYALGVIS